MDQKTSKTLTSLDIGKWSFKGSPHKMFLYGPPKSGKTSLALSSGTETLHVSTEPSANVLRNLMMEPYRDLVSVLNYTNMDDLLALVIGLREGHDSVKKFENVVIDTLDGISDLWLMNELDKKAKDARQDYKALLEAWLPVISNLAKAPVNVTVIAHQRDKLDPTGAFLGTSAAISNGVRQETSGMLDSYGVMKVQNGKYKISFKGTPMIEAGSRTDFQGKEIDFESFWSSVRNWENGSNRL